jgi:hypothetical protein
MINAYNVSVGKPEGKRPFGRHRRGWEHNFRNDLRKTKWEGMDWMHMTQDRNQWRALRTQ